MLPGHSGRGNRLVQRLTFARAGSFDGRSSEDLRESKRLERQVDRAVYEILTPEPTLFAPEEAQP